MPSKHVRGHEIAGFPLDAINGQANCGQDKQYDAGLCYPLCDADFHGVGPECWGRDSFCRGHSGFCGYHSSFLHNAAAVRYGVLSDTGAGATCAGRCWLSDAFSAETKTFSHEFAEAATDPDLNLGWIDISNGEIGDVCNSQFGPVDAGGGTHFIFQKEWSNKSNACRQ